MAKAIDMNGRKEWFCRSCSESNVCSRAQCLRCNTDIPAGLHAKHLQAMSTEKVRSLSASSSSCEGEDQIAGAQAQLAKDTALRELREKVRRLESDRKSQSCSLRNSTPTNTARTELHGMITFHDAKTRLKFLDCTSLCPLNNCHPRVMSRSLPHLTLTTSTSSLSPISSTSPTFPTVSPLHTGPMIPDTYVPCDVPRQSVGSTQIPSLTGYDMSPSRLRSTRSTPKRSSLKTSSQKKRA